MSKENEPERGPVYSTLDGKDAKQIFKIFDLYTNNRGVSPVVVEYDNGFSVSAQSGKISKEFKTTNDATLIFTETNFNKAQHEKTTVSEEGKVICTQQDLTPQFGLIGPIETITLTENGENARREWVRNIARRVIPVVRPLLKQGKLKDMPPINYDIIIKGFQDGTPND